MLALVAGGPGNGVKGAPTEGEMTPIGVTKDLYMLTLKYGEVFLQ